MKLVIVLALVALAVARPDSKLDNLNVDEIISTDRLFKNYVHCLVGQGKCTPEGNDIKKMMPSAISSSCGECSEKEKGDVAKFIKAIEAKYPTEYETLIKEHDPEGKYGSELKAFLEKYYKN